MVTSRKGIGGRSINGVCKRGHLIDRSRKRCTICKAASAAAWKKAHPRKVHDGHLRKYGITAADYEERFNTQLGRCAICRKPPDAKRLHVDHDHTTGAIRGLLCGACNTGIGLFQDDPEIMKRALYYVQDGGVQ